MAVKKSTSRMRINIKSFDHRLLEDVVKKIVTIVIDSGAKVVWPIPLPTKIEKITVNRSTFVNKDSREQFEIRRHNRLIDIIDPTEKTMELLQEVSVPNWVWIEIKV